MGRGECLKKDLWRVQRVSNLVSPGNYTKVGEKFHLEKLLPRQNVSDESGHSNSDLSKPSDAGMLLL